MDHRDHIARVESASFRLLTKFHIETDCGGPDHWAECEALVDAIGWCSWEDWCLAVEHMDGPMITAIMHPEVN